LNRIVFHYENVDYQHNAGKLSKLWHAKKTKQFHFFPSSPGHLIGFILLGSFCQNSLEEILVERREEKR